MSTTRIITETIDINGTISTHEPATVESIGLYPKIGYTIKDIVSETLDSHIYRYAGLHTIYLARDTSQGPISNGCETFHENVVVKTQTKSPLSIESVLDIEDKCIFMDSIAYRVHVKIKASGRLFGKHDNIDFVFPEAMTLVSAKIDVCGTDVPQYSELFLELEKMVKEIKVIKYTIRVSRFKRTLSEPT